MLDSIVDAAGLAAVEELVLSGDRRAVLANTYVPGTPVHTFLTGADDTGLQ